MRTTLPVRDRCTCIGSHTGNHFGDCPLAPASTSPDPVGLRVAALLYAGARRAYDYTPADERPERLLEEQADEE